MTAKPAIGIIASPGRRMQVIELAKEAERRGFSGLYCPTSGGTDCMALSQAIAQATNEIQIGTSVQPIYFRVAAELARSASFIHEISGGRFRLGVGVSHGVMRLASGVTAGSPLGDMRRYVADLKASEATAGPLPPIVLATLRSRMLALATEIADGAVWACGSRSYVASQVAAASGPRRAGFFLGDMVPTVVDDDEQAAASLLKRALSFYVQLPNYRNYWKEAGYVEEMEAAEAAIARGEAERLPSLMSDKWLRDNTLFGTAHKVREGVEAWRDAGVTMPILTPSSTSGGHAKAIRELFAAFE